MDKFTKAVQLPTAASALPGRVSAINITADHYVLGGAMQGPFPSEAETALFGLGCFWGAEKQFWLLTGVVNTAVGYAAGYTENPTYQEVCSCMTGHNEVVRVIFLPAQVSYQQLLETFWQAHDPTQGMRQGNDRGTQYRSGIYVYSDEQLQAAQHSKQQYQQQLTKAGLGLITTEIKEAEQFYFAEDYHQQYLAKNPNGYCGLGGTGVSYCSA